MPLRLLRLRVRAAAAAAVAATAAAAAEASEWPTLVAAGSDCGRAGPSNIRSVGHDSLAAVAFVCWSPPPLTAAVAIIPISGGLPRRPPAGARLPCHEPVGYAWVRLPASLPAQLSVPPPHAAPRLVVRGVCAVRGVVVWQGVHAACSVVPDRADCRSLQHCVGATGRSSQDRWRRRSARQRATAAPSRPGGSTARHGGCARWRRGAVRSPRVPNRCADHAGCSV